MADLKLPRIPDRKPVKFTISILPHLHQAIIEYAALYSQTYGREEPITELIPAMLEAFLESDRLFGAKRRNGFKSG
ncbi:hypothetical protein Sj15T_22110 [Sphingobium sp. TA15]|uniref:Transposase n=1 Tax=Sphingobium indicum (strain DSM 16413 / CCM 7287 / MTCC 6362 / UT26 / NBRC 101211 / UT26S) TaxID=452662 RepID=D4Z5B3_SPHIU|nr:MULTISPECIES: DUF2274 domain-containing protein [Sphingobium]WDA38636.1 DUF2274 domain-containing protein [Sphingobium sp. YC-XJ3]BAI97795.1 conserved hypothetical protein [Sphingobium indicum UT26S]BDD67190.1 hypothetical protein Sj15T_22110 [Sphingobium sp. TA15]